MNSGMRFRAGFPIVYVENLAASLTFYGELLGFAETYRFPAEGTPAFVALALPDGSRLALAAAADGEVGAHGQAIRPRAGRQLELCPYTADVARAVASTRERGASVLAKPVAQPWGERMAYVADPDNHPVMICAGV